MGATRLSNCSGGIACAGGGPCAGSCAARNVPVRSRAQTTRSARRETKPIFVIFPPPSRTELDARCDHGRYVRFQGCASSTCLGGLFKTNLNTLINKVGSDVFAIPSVAENH